MRIDTARRLGIGVLLPSCLLLGLLSGCKLPEPLLRSASGSLQPTVSAARGAGAASGPISTSPTQNPASSTAQTQTPPVISAQTLAAAFSDLSPQLQTLLDRHRGTYGFFLLDLNSGQSIGFHADDAFPAASTFKLPMATYVLQQADQGTVSLDDQLTITRGDWEDGTGVLQSRPVGTRYTIGALLDLLIEQSDNIAANMLLRRFGHETFWAFENGLGGKHTHAADRTNLTTPADLVRYLQAALDPAVLSAASRDRLLNDLRNTAFPIRIQAGVPAEIPVAHKIGTLENVVNDVGMVSFPGHPYLLAICSQNVGEGDADEVLAELSHQIYASYQQITQQPASQ